MKILHVTATHLRPIGGIPVVLKELVDEQNRLSDVTAKVLSINVSVDHMESEHFYFLGKEPFSSFIGRFQPDIVIFHSFYYIEYIKLYKELLDKNIPYLIEPHGSFTEVVMKQSKLKKFWANLLLFKRFVNNASGIIFLNEGEKERSVFHSKIELVIPNGIKIADTIVKMDKKEMSSRPEFYFIGRFDISYKGLDVLLSALNILEKDGEDLTVSFYGSGDIKQLQYMNDMISSFNHIHVVNKGALIGEQKRKELTGKIMILSSRTEGFPMTILEALSYGNPCLVTPGTNMQEEIVANHLGWGSQLIASDLAETMKKAVADYQANKQRYMETTKKFVKEQYSWDKIAKTSILQLKNTLKLLEDEKN